MPLEYLPSTSPLARYVEHVHLISPQDGHRQRVDRLPNGRTCIVFREFERGRGDVAVLGPFTRARLKHVHGLTRAVMFQFRPGWSSPLLGINASKLTDEHVFVEELWGRLGHELVEELLRARSTSEMLDGLARALASRLERTREPASAALVRRAVRILEQESVQVESVAARVGVTARHLRRAFAENIGVTPKAFTRAARLHRALALSSASANWPRIAVDAGYYDQAHLIADFRDLLGLTPTAFTERARDHSNQ